MSKKIDIVDNHINYITDELGLSIKALIDSEVTKAIEKVKTDFIREFTNDHDLMRPPRWLRGVAFDEQDLLNNILEFFDNQLKRKDKK